MPRRFARARPIAGWWRILIYLAPEARGRGVGRLLLDALVESCQTLGFRQMIAVIGGAHPASVAVHRAAGFTEVGLLKGTGYKHGRWLDTMLMQKALGEGADTDPDPSVYPGTLFGGSIDLPVCRASHTPLCRFRDISPTWAGNCIWGMPVP